MSTPSSTSRPPRPSGRIDDAVINPAARRVAGFTIAKAHGDWLEWDHLKALGADVATVSNAEAIGRRPEDAPRGPRHSKALGGRVLSDQGSHSEH